MSDQGSRPSMPSGGGQMEVANMLAGQIVTPLQNIVTKLGQILQALGGVSGFYAQSTIVFAQSPYTTLATDLVLLVDATGGNVTINLSAIGNPQIYAKKIDATANSVTLVGTIDNVANAVTTTQYKSYNLKRDTTNKWWLF